MSATPPGTGGQGGTWAGLVATAPQAMEWGIVLCGQLAAVHEEGEVVGNISPATIRRSRFGQPSLPEPDHRATHDPWVDVAALADAIGAVVPDPPIELANALLAPYASALALGEELQDAQRAMGLPVAPIPFEGATPVSLGGAPLEVPPDPEPSSVPDPHLDRDAAERVPNPWALLALAVIGLAVAVAIGVGWR